MNEELRVIQMMPISFAKDKLLLEDELEKAINGPEPISVKEIEIKRLLGEIVLNDEMIKKWTIYTAQEKQEE